MDDDQGATASRRRDGPRKPVPRPVAGATLEAMSSDTVERHVRALRGALRARRTVPLEGNGFAVSRALEGAILPPDDARCGVLTRRFQYGGSVPEGWAEARTLSLTDALIETTDYDFESNTFVEIRAVTEARAEELARVVKEVRDRLAASG